MAVGALAPAIRDAIAQLLPQGIGIADWLSIYSVMSIGAEIGGIAGVNHPKCSSLATNGFWTHDHGR